MCVCVCVCECVCVCFSMLNSSPIMNCIDFRGGKNNNIKRKTFFATRRFNSVYKQLASKLITF